MDRCLLTRLNWYDPNKDGQGYILQWQPDGRLLVYFYGYRDNRSNLSSPGGRAVFVGDLPCC